MSEPDFQEAMRDPEEELKRLLEHAGHVVNHIDIGRWEPRADMVCDYVHVAYPEEEQSTWIVVDCQPWRA